MGAALVLQTQDNCPPGLFDDWAALRGISLDVLRIDRWEHLPAPAEYELAIILGSDMSMASALQGWVSRLIDWIVAADRAGLPILGICFGAQALAVALGGSVTRLHEPEHAWIKVQTRDTRRIPGGPWLGIHEDRITLPPFAEELASNASGVQAFALGGHLGVQFHPEITPSIVSRWVSDKAGLISRDLLEDLDAHCRAAAAGALALFDAFIGRTGHAARLPLSTRV